MKNVPNIYDILLLDTATVRVHKIDLNSIYHIIWDSLKIFSTIAKFVHSTLSIIRLWAHTFKFISTVCIYWLNFHTNFFSFFSRKWTRSTRRNKEYWIHKKKLQWVKMDFNPNLNLELSERNSLIWIQ